MSTENTYLCDEYQMFFKIEEDVQILKAEMDIYNESFLGNNAFCHEAYIEDTRTLTYSIPAMLSLSQFMKKKLHRDELLEIMYSVTDQLIYMEANNMPLGKVILKIGYMYINVEDMAVQLIYLPIDKKMDSCDMEGFIRDLLNEVRYANLRASNCGYDLLQYFDRHEHFDLASFYKLLVDLKEDEAKMAESELVIAGEAGNEEPAEQTEEEQAAEEAEAEEKKSQSAGFKLAKEKRDYSMSDIGFAEADTSATTVLTNNKALKPGPYLIRTRTGERIRLNKPIFCIGKSSQGVDYQVTDNSSVSRRHAYILNVNGVYYLRDNKSTNHTYLAGRAVSPENDMMLIDGSRFKLANEEFTFHEK